LIIVILISHHRTLLPSGKNTRNNEFLSVLEWLNLYSDVFIENYE